MSNSYDIIFCVLPPMLADRIYTTPAVLKGIVQSQGYRARCFDFSIELLNYCQRDTSLFARIQNYYMIANIEQSAEEEKIVKEFYNKIIDTITSVNTKYIGLTVFSMLTHKVIVEVLIKLKELGLTDKVVLGGRGLTALTFDTVKEFLPITDEDMQSYFVDVLKKYGLVKHAIVGDGEDSIIEFLQNNEQITPGINNANLNVVHYPDYSDYNIEDYLWADNQPHLLVTGSTGCVRDCDFCDIKHAFGKYKFKQGTALAEEIIYLQNHYGINKFILTDSLINGGMKPFKDFLLRLKEHNSTSIQKIIWSGQYICRNEIRHKKDIDLYYQLLKESGAEGLTIGAESGSNHVLAAMDKKTTVEALFFELDYFRKYGITCSLLTFSGHWSEHHEHFIDHCRMLNDLVPYVKSGTVAAVYLGRPFKVLPNTPADNNLNIIKHKKDYNIWICRNNRANTYKARLKRKLITDSIARQLRIPHDDEETEILQHESEFIRNNLDEINNFFTRHSKDHSGYIENDQDFIFQEIFKHKSTFNLKLQVEANSYNGLPQLKIVLNNQTLFDDCLIDGSHDINLNLSVSQLREINQLEFHMPNKCINDTLVDSTGKIIKDKNIVFTSLYIDNCDVLMDIEFFYKNFYLSNTNEKNKPTQGLWSDTPLCLEFGSPFVHWYANTSDRGLSSSHLDARSASCLKDDDGIYLNKLRDQLKQLIV